MFETFAWWLLAAFGFALVASVIAYLVSCWLFVRTAERMAREVDRRVGAAAARTFTHLANYAEATGIRHRGHDVAAVAEGKQRKLAASQAADGASWRIAARCCLRRPSHAPIRFLNSWRSPRIRPRLNGCAARLAPRPPPCTAISR